MAQALASAATAITSALSAKPSASVERSNTVQAQNSPAKNSYENWSGLYLWVAHQLSKLQNLKGTDTSLLNKSTCQKKKLYYRLAKAASLESILFCISNCMVVKINCMTLDTV